MVEKRLLVMPRLWQEYCVIKRNGKREVHVVSQWNEIMHRNIKINGEEFSWRKDAKKKLIINK